MPRRIRGSLVVLLLCLAPAGAMAQQKPYTEGSVMTVSYIQIKPGMFDNYVQWLDTKWKPLMEAQKKAGLITAYSVFNSPARDREDWNMVLTVTYKNMAALDGFDDRADPIARRLMGSDNDQNKATIDRGEMREVLGARMLRELVLK